MVFNKSSITILKGWLNRQKRSPKVLILVNLIQDLDLLLPLAIAFNKESSVNVEVAVVDRAFNESPRIDRLLRQAGIQPSCYSRTAIITGLQPKPLKAQALITASESTCGPHRAAHALTKRANQAGIPTFTLQHGFENYGLTYFDSTYPALTTKFASNRILIWGSLSTLHADTPEETRIKCVSVGCPKYINSSETGLKFSHDRSKLIAIFENLHWERYDDAYRKNFIQDVIVTAHNHPEVTFLIKPHHAGLWLTQKYGGHLPVVENLLIVDPSKPQWEHFTAPALLEIADAAITTPSTVALDAARGLCPVAVAGYSLELTMYEPLTILKSTQNWEDWVHKLDSTNGYEAEKLLGQRFLAEKVISGDAVSRIVKQINNVVL